MKKILKGLMLSLVFLGAAFMLTGCQSSDNQSQTTAVEPVKNTQVQQNAQTKEVKKEQTNETSEDKELVQILDTLEKE